MITVIKHYADDELIRELYLAGSDHWEIAKKLNIHWQDARRWIRRLGLSEIDQQQAQQQRVDSIASNIGQTGRLK